MQFSLTKHFFFRTRLALAFLCTCFTTDIFAASVNLSWSANTESDLAGYKVYYGTTSRNYGTPVNVGNVTTYTLIGLNAGTYFFATTAYDSSGNESMFSNEASMAISSTPDTTAPVISAVGASSVTSSGTTINWTTSEASDTQVECGTTTAYGSSTALVSTLVTGHSTVLSGLQASKLYHYRVKSRDAAGNLALSSDFIFTTVAAGSGLVAAYGFDEGSGTTISDASGKSNTGTINGATWSTQGKFGSALSFNGSNWVTVNDSSSLDLTTGMTLEAWVYPSATPTNWSTVLMKEQSSALVYTLYAGSPTNRPNVFIYTSSEQGFGGPDALPLNSWSHLAGTYDGATLRLYVNGTQVASQSVPGSITNSGGAFRIGGNGVWNTEFFQGQIDEVRVYNRPLSQTEIQSDMNSPIGGAAPPRCDCNSDGATNALDLQAEVNTILAGSSYFSFDINHDGTVNALDLQILGNVVLGVTTCP